MYLQTVVITGGSQGMGRGLGKLLAQKGANVVIVARDPKKLESALEYISVLLQFSGSGVLSRVVADLNRAQESVHPNGSTTSAQTLQSPKKTIVLSQR